MREGERARERAPERADPCLDRLLLLFWAHYIRMALVYYAQVHCRWLPFTDNKGQNTGNYFKERDVTAQGGKWLNWLHSILGWFSTDFRKLKINSVNICCLSPGWGSFSKSKSHSSLGTMQTWFPTGEPVCGRESCLPNSHPLAFPRGNWATFPMCGTVPHTVLLICCNFLICKMGIPRVPNSQVVVWVP